MRKRVLATAFCEFLTTATTLVPEIPLGLFPCHLKKRTADPVIGRWSR
jgi:hypothetical protein